MVGIPPGLSYVRKLGRSRQLVHIFRLVCGEGAFSGEHLLATRPRSAFEIVCWVCAQLRLRACCPTCAPFTPGMASAVAQGRASTAHRGSGDSTASGEFCLSVHPSIWQRTKIAYHVKQRCSYYLKPAAPLVFRSNGRMHATLWRLRLSGGNRLGLVSGVGVSAPPKGYADALSYFSCVLPHLSAGHPGIGPVSSVGDSVSAQCF